MSPPTKQEIIKKYCHLFTAEEIEILYQDNLPNPEQMKKDKCFLQSLGTFKGFMVFVKKNFVSGALMCFFIIAALPSFSDGLIICRDVLKTTQEQFSFFAESFYNNPKEIADRYITIQIENTQQTYITKKVLKDYFPPSTVLLPSSLTMEMPNLKNSWSIS